MSPRSAIKKAAVFNRLIMRFNTHESVINCSQTKKRASMMLAFLKSHRALPHQ
ncbi:hypothetical protein O59_002193 [Cellvibrio sp. BR]|nr:hypothetical protein O59_002193 [Cellvibrio sp. BR]